PPRIAPGARAAARPHLSVPNQQSEKFNGLKASERTCLAWRRKYGSSIRYALFKNGTSKTIARRNPGNAKAIADVRLCNIEVMIEREKNARPATAISAPNYVGRQRGISG